ncbi:MAG: radical SAM protein [Kofleriaceae bacterium]
MNLTRQQYMEYGAPMLEGASFQADVVLVAPREFEVTRSQRTYREKNFTSFTERLDISSFQRDFIRRINEALGLEALAPYLRAVGLKVAILNCNVAPHSTEELARKIIASGAKVVGISMIYRPQAAQALDLIEALRVAPEIKVAVGGALASYMPMQLLSRLARLDAVVFGEAEETFRDYAKAVVDGTDYSNLPGVAFKQDGRVRINDAATPLHLPEVLAPSRDTLGYLALTNHDTRIASLYTSRGCMAGCTFCTGKDAYNVGRKKTYRYRDPKAVVDEIEALHAEFGVRFVYINDDNFLGYGRASYERVREFAQTLIDRKLGIQFATECRVDGLHDETLKLLKRAGMVQVLLGIESGSDAVLVRWKKGATVAQNKAALTLTRELGIQVEPGFILLDAETTQSEMFDNLRFIRESGLERTLFPLYMINRLSVYPGTAIEPTLIKLGTIRPSAIQDNRLADNPLAVREEFQRLEYLCNDRRTEIVWRALRWAIEPFEQGVEDVMPRVTAVLTKARTLGDPEVRRRAGELIRSASQWRRRLGELTTRFLELGAESYDVAGHHRQFLVLRSRLRAAREVYERETLNMSMDAFMEQVMELRAALPAGGLELTPAPSKEISAVA